MTVFYYASVSTTDGQVYLLGYEVGNPSTSDVQILRLTPFERNFPYEEGDG
jgi:hypothetical protein